MKIDSKASGLAIAEAREEREITQKQLAEAVGCSPSSISRIELGVDMNDPRFYKMRVFAKAAADYLNIDLVVVNEPGLTVRCLTCANLHVVELGSLERPRKKGLCMHYGDGKARRGCTHFEGVVACESTS